MNRLICIFLTNNMANDDRDFLLKLPKDLHKIYRDKKAALIKNNDAKWSDDQHGIKKHKAIDLDTDHNRILNACIFPFVQQNRLTQELNYAYIRSSPLSEFGVKNVDFLLASKTDDVVIFGEAKGTIANPRAVIAEYKERIKIIEEKSSYIKNMLPGTKSLEYVLGVPSDRAMEMSKAIARSSADIILWQVGIWSGDKLSLVVPSTDDSTRQKMMHSNNALNKELGNEGVPTSTNFKTFYHESHPVTKMTVLTSIDSESESFTFDDLKLHIIDELDNTPDTEITTITKQIMEWAIDIGFVRCLDDETYKIQSRFKHANARYNELKIKWINRRIEIEKELDLRQKLEELQTELSVQHTSLEDY